MATFVEIQTDSFAGNLAQLKEQAKSGLDFSGVRRPLRGIEIKEDTYGIIKVIRNDGSEIPLTDSGGSRPPQSGSSSPAGSGIEPKTQRQGRAHTYNYSNFIIQRIEESRQEKQQIIETFGDTFIFFYGERPRILQVTGLLMNTRDFNWRTEFWWNYDNVLRGTKLVEQNARLYLFWDDVVVEGYMLSANAQDISEMPYHIPFTFQLFVTNHTYLSAVGDDAYPTTHAVVIQPLLTQRENIGEAIAKLKSVGIASATTEDRNRTIRRHANLISLGAQLGGQALTSGSAAGIGKNLLTDALVLGLSASNLSFLSVIEKIFKKKSLRIPQRTTPLRSKIRDNVDEYVGGTSNTDVEKVRQRELEDQFCTLEDVQSQILEDLARVGINPIQHPGGSQLSTSHAIAVTANTSASTFSKFALPKLGA